jgi:hypothetical protein
MLPKKGRKEIIVDGVLYHYIKKYNDDFVTIIKNTETGELIKRSYEGVENPIWGNGGKPSDVEKIIRKHKWKK